MQISLLSGLRETGEFSYSASAFNLLRYVVTARILWRKAALSQICSWKREDLANPLKRVSVTPRVLQPYFENCCQIAFWIHLIQYYAFPHQSPLILEIIALHLFQAKTQIWRLLSNHHLSESLFKAFTIATLMKLIFLLEYIWKHLRFHLYPSFQTFWKILNINCATWKNETLLYSYYSNFTYTYNEMCAFPFI